MISPIGHRNFTTAAGKTLCMAAKYLQREGLMQKVSVHTVAIFRCGIRNVAGFIICLNQ